MNARGFLGDVLWVAVGIGAKIGWGVTAWLVGVLAKAVGA